MSTKNAHTLVPLLICVCLLQGCSAPSPTELPLDDTAQALDDGARSRLRAAQEEYRQRCQAALAFKSVAAIERPEPGGFVDEEFRNMKWPDWVEDETPKALIFYSRAPELIQVRFSNRWLPTEGQTALRTALSETGRGLAAAHRPDEAALASAQALAGGCPRPEAQGWIARQYYDGLEEARDTINDYSLPRRHWYTGWYYTVAFDPLLNGFLLLSSLLGFSSSMLILFPLIVALCLDKKAVDLLAKLCLLPIVLLIKLAVKVRPEWAGARAVSAFSISAVSLALAFKGFRTLLGLPTYAVLCIVLLGRPEDVLTAQNHLYSWMPVSALSNIPMQGSILGLASPLAPAGWLAGLVYFVAFGINQADEIYKTAQVYNTDDEVLEERLGVLSEVVKEQRNQGDEVLMNWGRQFWRAALFSLAIAWAPLALSLYFVIKAVADAAWVVASYLGEKIRVGIPVVLRALPHAALLFTLVAAYTRLPAGSAVAEVPRPPAPPTQTVGASAVAVREKPSRKGRVVGRLKRGDEVQVVGDAGAGWSEVKLADGTAGYVPGSALSTTAPANVNAAAAGRAATKRRRGR
ncbi:MAG: SH3 domain-containing protein [Acidobacteria bacterium]|nr:SH3 domain-containing protein [Acidobacteriota bacterium]